MKPWVLYSVIRVGLFAGVFAFLMVISVPWYFSALIAAVVSLCVAYIFFGRLRDAVALDIAARRARPAGDLDTAAEDR